MITFWPSWLRNLKKSTVTPARRRRYRPRLEVLEDRLAPALLTVTSLADDVTDNGQLTLREALQAANTDTTVDGVTGNGDDGHGQHV